jgi:pimeloyl-ACP methyl ester carboxylesterase
VSWSGKVLRWSFGSTSKPLPAVRFLQRQAGVNPKAVGIYGHSQGGTISPLIASRPGAVAFVIAAAAIGTGQLYTQDLYRTRNYLLDIGLTDPDLSHAMEFYTLWINTVRTGRGIDEYEEALAKARQEKWFATLGIPPRDHWLWKWYPPIGNLDPLPYWEKVRVPVLLIYGELDRNTPVGPSLAGIGRALDAAGNPDVTPIIIPGAVHNLTIQPEKGQPFFWWHAAPGYKDLLIAWVRARF